MSLDMWSRVKAFFGAREKSGGSSVMSFFGLTPQRTDPLNPLGPMSNAEMLELKAKVAAVWSCVTAISQAFQEARLCVYQIEQGGAEEEVPESPWMVPFLDNPWLSANDLLRYMSEHLELSGASYLWKWKARAGHLAEVWPIPPQWVMPEPIDTPLQAGAQQRVLKWYRISPPGAAQILVPPEDMVYTRDINPASLWQAMGALQPADPAVTTEEKADEYQVQSFDSLKAPGLIISSAKPLTPRQQEDLHRVLEEKLGGSGRRNAIVLSGEGVKAEMVNPLSGMDWTGLRHFDEVRICQVFRVPPIVAGCWVGMVNSPWSNTKDAWRAFYSNKMVGRWQQFAQSLTRGIMGEDARQDDGSRLEYRFDTSDIVYLRDELDVLVDRSIKMFQGGLITRNRALEMVGEDKIEEPIGDEILQPMSLVVAGQPQEGPLPPDEHLPPEEEPAQEEPTQEPEEMFSKKGGPGSGNFGHEGRPGERGGSASTTQAQTAFSETMKNGGASVGFSSRHPKTGFMVSPYKEHEQVVRLAKDKSAVVKKFKEFFAKNKDTLKQKDHFFGAWVSKGKVYMDISVNVKEKSEAIKIAKNHEQLAIWDVKNMQEVPTK